MKYRDFAFLGLIGALFYLSKLWQGDLRGDSLFYAEIAREILKTKDVFTLHFAGSPYFNKPPFLFWLTALAYKIFGVNTFSAKIWSSLNAVLSGFALYLLANEIFDRKTALLSASILLLTRDFIKDNVALRMDSTLVLFIILYLFFLLKNKAIPSGVFLGFALLTKGLAGVIPILIALFSSIFLGKKFLKHTLVSIPLGLLIFSPWFLVELKLYGSTFIKIFLMKESIGRVLGTSFSFSKGKSYYLKNLLETYWPWFALLPVALYKLAKQGGKEQKGLILTWILVVAFSLLFPKPEYGRYLMPIYPAFALAIGYTLSTWLNGETVDRIRDRATPFLIFSFILVNILPIRLHREAYRDLRALKPAIEFLGGKLALYKPSHSRIYQATVFYIDPSVEVIKKPEGNKTILTEKKNLKELHGFNPYICYGRFCLLNPP